MQEHAVEGTAVLARWSNSSEGTSCHLEIGQDRWIADVAGTDPGHATPHEIIDAALASCTALSLRFYAKHKGWSVSGIEVAVTHKLVQGRYRLERRISLGGDLTAEQRAGLLRVAQACPVYKTLTGDIAIDTSIA